MLNPGLSRPPDRMSTVARSSARRSGFSQPSGITAVPSSILAVRCEAAASTATGEEIPNWKCRCRTQAQSNPSRSPSSIICQRDLMPRTRVLPVEQPDRQEPELVQGAPRLWHALSLRQEMRTKLTARASATGEAVCFDVQIGDSSGILPRNKATMGGAWSGDPRTTRASAPRQVTVIGFSHGAATSAGRVRRVNEDSHLALPPLFVVADGMGGHGSGNVASGIAIEEMTACAALRPLFAEAVLTALEQANGTSSSGTRRTGWAPRSPGSPASRRRAAIT